MIHKNLLFGTPEFTDWASPIQRNCAPHQIYIKDLKDAEQIINFISTHKIDLIIPTTYPQMKFIIDNNISKITGVSVAGPKTYDSVELLDNKCKFSQFMISNNLGHLHPRARLLKENNQIILDETVQFPVIFKYFPSGQS